MGGAAYIDVSCIICQIIFAKNVQKNGRYFSVFYLYVGGPFFLVCCADPNLLQTQSLVALCLLSVYQDNIFQHEMGTEYCSILILIALRTRMLRNHQQIRNVLV